MSDYEEAQWTIPFCDFEWTPDGFKVKFAKPRPLSFFRVFFGLCFAIFFMLGSFILGIAIGADNESWALGIGIPVGGIFVSILVLILIFGGKLRSVIQVTPDSVIVDGKRLERSAFAHFKINRKVGTSGEGAVLGYRYGNRSFEFGGVWNGGEATEFLSSLNRKVRSAPLADDVDNPSQQMLRAARPTDF